MNLLHTLLLLAALLVAFKLDFDAQIEERENYCEMVKTGAWPNYRADTGDECQ